MKWLSRLAPLLLAGAAFAAETGPLHDKQPPKPGVPAVQVPFDSLTPSNTFDVGGVPDWMVITNDSVWLANRPQKKVRRIDPATNTIVAEIDFPKSPCSGINAAFGSIWVPLCDAAAPALARVDAATNKIAAILPFGPIDTEGGITVSGNAVWMVIDTKGTLARIDPATHSIAALHHEAARFCEDGDFDNAAECVKQAIEHGTRAMQHAAKCLSTATH